MSYPSCELEAVQRAAHSGSFAIRSICGIEEVYGALVATAGEDLGLRLWTVPGLRLVSEIERADAAGVSGMICVRRGDQLVLVCGGDAVSPDGVRSSEGAPIFLLRVPELTRLATLTAGSTGYAKYLVPLSLDGFSYVLAKLEHEALKLFGMYEARFVATTEATLDVFGSMPQSGSSVLVFGTEYGRLSALEVQSSSDRGNYEVNILPPTFGLEVNGSAWQGPMRIGSRNTVACADGHQLRLWEVEDLLAAQSPSLRDEPLASPKSTKHTDKELSTRSHSSTTTVVSSRPGTMD